MAGSIDMVNEGLPMANSPESVVQPGGGASGIEMYGGDMPFTLKHTPVPSEQKGGGGGTVDWVGEQGLLDRSVVTPYGSKWPSDKGE